ncbi:pirin domain-containing protein [Cristinia sonorae]|uniref:Pirin domain-containing protein n=1 Tax=Cristinia sonorae TaxID=1940300 RepID=A0A8K0XTB0_9AGAR|nr:pirin domain-containing protein [Cristinia sonorae]
MSSLQIIPHRSNKRGNADHGWSKVFHTFSFAMYQTNTHNHYGHWHLRVLNEDRVQPFTDFVETIGNIEILKRGLGYTQMISVGTGIRHSEKNNGEDEAHLLQIWAILTTANLSPAYYIRHFLDEDKYDKWVRTVAPVGSKGVRDQREASGPSPVHSPLTVFVTLLSPDKEIFLTFPRPRFCCSSKGYIHVIQTSGYNAGNGAGGRISVSAGNRRVETVLREGDGAYMMADGGSELVVTNTGDSTVEIILIDME